MELRKLRSAIAAATIHPSHAITFPRLRIFGKATLALPRSQLVQHLLQSAQHSDLALRVVQLQAFDAGFEPVQLTKSLR